MEGRIKLIIFIIVFFASFFLTEYLDSVTAGLTDSEFWQNLIPAAPLVAILLILGFFEKKLAQLVAYSLGGAAAFVIYMGTQEYFDPERSPAEWNVFSQTGLMVVAFFSFALVVAAFSIGFFLAFGRMLAYVFEVLSGKSKNAANLE